MHIQHAKGFSLCFEKNFNFLPHILQKQQDKVGRWFLVVFKCILLFDVAAIPIRQAPQATYLTHAHPY
jgi:hypothetical protein